MGIFKALDFSFLSKKMSAHVFRRVPIAGAQMYEVVKPFRAVASAVPTTVVPTKLTVEEALSQGVTKIDFLEVDTLGGVPVNTTLSTAKYDGYLAGHLRDFYKRYF